jgi:hypothetical protein
MVVVFVLLAAIAVVFATNSCQSSSVNAVSESTRGTVAPNSPNESSADVSNPLTSDAVKSIMQDIDNRVSWIKVHIDHQWYDDHYEGDTAIYRYFAQGVEDDSVTTYFLYYDKYGKLIYSEIAHYRAALYSIFFHSNELLYVEVGPFHAGGTFINGNISDVQTVIAEDPSYAFVLEDLAFCLSHAYQSNLSPASPTSPTTSTNSTID